MSSAAPAPSPVDESVALRWQRDRERMVATQLRGRDIRDQAVLAAMAKVPRHLFIPADRREGAYGDHPVGIGHEQTISQPYIVALMTQLARVRRGARVLEIGTGSGYQTAVLAELGAEVYSIEIVAPLARRAEAILRRLRYDRVHLRTGDGYVGWPEAAPFDAVIVTAAPPEVPEPLRAQLAVGGTLVVPVGRELQSLRVITRTAEGYEEREVTDVRFVPMTGRAQE